MPSVGPWITAIGSWCLSSINTGLGNVLFQIAGCYGLSKLTGATVDYRRVKEYSDLLKYRFGFDHGQTILRSCQIGSSEPYVVYSDRSLNCPNGALIDDVVRAEKTLLVDGYFAYPPYFNGYRDDILQLFSPDETSLRYIHEKVPELGDDSRITVSIHIRVLPDANTHTPLSYYQNAVSYILERIPNAVFLVFSDGDPGDIGVPYIRVKLDYDYQELWAMSLCKHAITSYSTFSWWGAYLNTNPSKIVTYPQHALDYLSANSRVSKLHLQRTYFLDSVCIP